MILKAAVLQNIAAFLWVKDRAISCQLSDHTLRKYLATESILEKLFTLKRSVSYSLCE